MGFLGFGRGRQARLVVVTYEGPGRLMLNGNRTHNDRSKKHAASHSQTVCWIEFDVDGIPIDQGLGPASGRLGSGEAERLLRELPRNSDCRSVLAHMNEGRDQTGRWMKQVKSTPAARGSAV